MPTAQQLVDVSTKLTDVVKAINVIVGKQHLPFDGPTANLSNTAFQLGAQANTIGQAGIDMLAIDVQLAIGQLTTQVAAARSALADINDVKIALGIVGSILTGAAGIAANVATGNWAGAASAIVTTAQNIEKAISANKPAAAGADAKSAAAATAPRPAAP